MECATKSRNPNETSPDAGKLRKDFDAKGNLDKVSLVPGGAKELVPGHPVYAREEVVKRAWPRGWFVFTAATVARFWACVDKAGGEDACWLFAGPLHPQGYGLVTFEGEPMGAHRMSCILAHGQPPRTRAHASRLALHSCDNPPCVNPRHLRWGSPRENTQEMLTRGRGVHQRKLRERLALAGAAAS